ncbi:hypothetical protein M0804_009248 [Polistes exclamans]|nr:hypothetical protein M0804_009248 [Polistes exclamans]
MSTNSSSSSNSVSISNRRNEEDGDGGGGGGGWVFSGVGGGDEPVKYLTTDSRTIGARKRVKENKRE